MPIITLTTDFGLKDHSVAAVKGALYSEIEDTVVIDISHQISPFNIIEAAYIIKNAYHNFPEGSIHIIGVDAELTPENKHIAVYLDNHYFICANNGIVSLITSEIKPDKIVEINIHKTLDTSFTVLDIFVKVAGHILRGGKLEIIGKPIETLKQIKYIEPQINALENQLIGHVVYIDNFGNVITNIKKTFFEPLVKGRKFVISVRHVEFKEIYETYSDAINFDLPPQKRGDSGKKIAIFNASGYLELAIYKSNPHRTGGASSLLGLDMMDTITINFYDD
ncbi:SAM hydrolase/SAM-dependent halogenase family protein [Psychroflexus sp. MBR-150]|jgi:S-adenosylmethionine hydrolase